MLELFMIAAALSGPAVVPEAPQRAGMQLVLQVRVISVYPDGSVRGYAAGSDPEAFDGYVYSGPEPCTIGGSNSDPTARKPEFGWRIAGRVLERNGKQFLAQVDWQRHWVQGKLVTDSRKESQQLSISIGDRIMLDQFDIPPSDSCDALGVRLEATVEERPIPPPRAKMTGTVGAVAGGGGAGAAAGGRVVPILPLQDPATRGASGSGAAAGGRGAASSELAVFGPGVASLGEPAEVDLFLVHVRPDGSEDVKRMRVPASPNSRFHFEPISVETSVGPATLLVGGAIAAVVTDSGERQLRVVIDRQIMNNPKINGRGQSLGAYKMPGASDVYSFETPQLSSRGVPVTSDRVSVRMKLASRRE